MYDWCDSSDIFWSDEEGEHDDNDDKDGKFEEVKKKKEELKEDSLKKRGTLCPDSFRKDDVTLIHGKEEGNMENIQSTDRGSSVKANVKDNNRKDYRSSPGHWESDDPRKGGKGYAEKVADRDTKNGDTFLKEELVFKKEASINELCVQMKLANPGVSLLETVREKGYESISKLVKGFFYNKNENSEKILDDGRSTINRNANEIINN